MHYRAKLSWAALAIVALYSFCTNCPDRLLRLPIGAQRSTASALHSDCENHHNQHNRSEPRCPDSSHDYLPTSTLKVLHGVTHLAWPLSPGEIFFSANFFPHLSSAKPPGLGPPASLLVTKLRI